jgi:serine/threonine protein phosphatase PrpC
MSKTALRVWIWTPIPDSDVDSESSAFTHQGHFRSRNEDALLDRSEQGLWVVCDGMGGHEAGDYASQWIVNALASLSLSDQLATSIHSVRRCLKDCNDHLVEYARRKGMGQIGSTVVALLIQSGRAVVLWAGDSRAYRLRLGRFRQVTDDHSYAEEMARTTGRRPAPGEPGSEVITRAVGAGDELDLDSLVLEVRRGDRWLLCSDGVSGSVDPFRLEELLAGDLAEAAEALVDEALENGSRDNCTAICVGV